MSFFHYSYNLCNLRNLWIVFSRTLSLRANMAEPSVAIVTGASSGIGQETALAFARKRYAVVLAARRTDRLNEVARACRQAGAPEALAVPTDVGDEAQVQALVERAVGQFARVDVLVNNAGYGQFARVHETATQDMQDIFRVNFFGLFYGCKAVAPVMIRQRSGHIFNISSVIGRRGTPFHGAYCATKFAVIGLTDSIRVELKPYGVRVTAVLPALTQTEFFQRSRRGRAAGASFQKWKTLTPPSVVAEKIVRAVGHNRPQITLTFGGKLLVLISALSPRLADALMGRYHRDLAKRLKDTE